ncbi:MAG: polysaccharide deacetylase [Clostridia bacterium]|jgi:LysM repeat protein/outer membrane protein assembly factor BamB|nr:polysaccharide deacetylase [Clostridia bacterium]
MYNDIYYRENEQYGYMAGQEDSWYMSGRTPYNTNYAPVDFNLITKFEYDKLFGMPIAFTKDTVYVIENNILMAVDWKGFRIKWRFLVNKPSPSINPNAIVLKDNWIYVMIDATLYAIEDLGESYQIRWSLDHINFVPAYITYDHQNLYAQMYKGETWSTPEERKITSYDLKTGEKKWEMTPQNGLNLNILAGKDKLLALGQHDINKNIELTGINTENGQVDWTYSIGLENMPHVVGRPVYFDDIVYFVTEEYGPSGLKTYIYAIKSLDGTLVWKFTPISSLDITAPISVSNDILLYDRSYKTLGALNRVTGELLWESRYSEKTTTYNNQERPILTNQYIFLDDNAKIKVFDVKTGAIVKQWTQYDLAPSLTPVVPKMINSDRMIVQGFDGFISLSEKALEKKQYSVRSGDTLYKIASAFKTSIEYLAKLNNLNPPYALMVGQSLIVPNVNIGYLEHVIKPGDTLYKIALMYNITIQDIVQANNLANVNYLYIGQILKIPGSLTHTVKAGDTLWLISQMYKVPIGDIMQKNSLPSSGMIYIGQKLIIK